MGRDYDINQKVYENIDAVNLPQVAEFQQNHFGSKAFYYCVLGSKDRISQQELKKLGKVKVLTMEQIFGE